MTIIEPTPTPTQPTKGRRRAIILAAAAAVVGAVVLASCDDDSTEPITNRAPATSQPPPTTGGAQDTVDDTAADVAQPVVEAAPAEPVSPPPPEAFEACLPGNSGPGPDATKELSIPTPAGEVRLVRERGEIYEGVLRSDDPRFQGTHYFSYETDIYTLPDGREIAIRHYHNRIETVDGVWQGSPGPIILDAVNNVPDLALTGEGAYEGLMALATWLSVYEADPNLQPTDPSCDMQFTGYVVSVF